MSPATDQAIKRLRSAVEAILRSGEVKRLAAAATSLAQSAARQAAAEGGLSGAAVSAIDILGHRATGLGKGSRAARPGRSGTC